MYMSIAELVSEAASSLGAFVTKLVMKPQEAPEKTKDYSSKNHQGGMTCITFSSAGVVQDQLNM